MLAATGCRRQPNVLLVTFDTTRADHVGYAAGRKDVTPVLDARAARGSWFSTCVSSQPLTLPSHASLMTGLQPYRHGVRNNGTYVLPRGIATLASLLSGSGYATQAVVSAFVLDSQFGLDRGFDGYDDDLSGGPRQKLFMFREVPASATADRAIRWLRSGRPSGRPFLLWLHFFDPHADYEPPADVAARFPGDPYRGEIAFADRELGRVLATVEELGLSQRTLLVFTSDHGESLGEHGEKTHGLFAYDATTRVPLLLQGPGVPAGRRLNGVVRSVDVLPTVLELAGAAVPGGLDGQSLVPLLRGKADERVAYSETFVPRLNFGWAELRSLRSGAARVVEAPRREAYDLAADPAETRNLLGPGRSLPGTVRPLLAQLQQLVKDDPFTRGEQREAALDAETRKKLAALGYVWGAASAGTGPLPDPKDRLDFWRRFETGQDLVRKGDYPAAVALLGSLVAEDTNNVVAMASLANALARTGEKEKALELYRRLMVLDPHREAAPLGAARLLRERNDFRSAEELVRGAIEMQPANPEGYVALGDVFLDEGRYPEAERWFRKALEVDPHSGDGAAGLGNCLNRAGRLKEARDVLAAARAHDPSNHPVTYNLAVVTERLGDQKGAFELYRLAIRLDPDHALSWNNLGSLLDRTGRRAEAIGAFAKARELDRTSVEAAFNLGALLLLSGKAAEALPHLEEAVRLQPALRQATVYRARALAMTGRADEAVDALLRLARGGAPLAWLSIANVELSRGRTAEARRALAEGLKAGGEPARAAAAKDPGLSALLPAR